MTAITIELVQAKQAELQSMIEQLAAPAAAMSLVVLSLPAFEVALRAGEHYAGVVLDEEGHIKHHLVLMADRPDGRLSWDGAIAWAAKVGGELPTRQEQALLFANCRSHIEADWYWSSEVNGSSCAWYCYFGYGYQYCCDRSAEGRAVAVRRLVP